MKKEHLQSCWNHDPLQWIPSGAKTKDALIDNDLIDRDRVCTCLLIDEVMNFQRTLDHR